jgi:hypothetical protein
MADDGLHYDFRHLTSAGRERLFDELAVTHSELANLAVRIGFLKAEELREPHGYAKTERVQKEATMRAWEEKKWLLVRLLDG